MEIEEMIMQLPYNLYREHEYRCHCGAVHKKNYRYELEIKILPHFELDKPAYRFLAYYKNNEIPLGDSNKYIGHACGFGQATLKEAIQELKGYIND